MDESLWYVLCTLSKFLCRYAPYTLEFSVGAADESLFYAIYMLPADGVTRTVVRWGSAPADLDLYIVPIGVRDPASTAIGDPSSSLWMYLTPHIWSWIACL